MSDCAVCEQPLAEDDIETCEECGSEVCSGCFWQVGLVYMCTACLQDEEEQ